MASITVLGGTGYAGAAIVAEAASRGHRVTSLSRSAPAGVVEGVTSVRGDVSDEAVLAAAIEGADAVVEALSPRGALAPRFRETVRTIARLSDEAGAALYVVGGFSSLRPAAGADRFIEDERELDGLPGPVQDEVRAGAALILEDLPTTPDSLDWVFVSPARGFGAHVPGSRTGRYRRGGEVAVDPTGGAISAEDYAIGVVDLIEAGDRHREQVNLGY